MNASEEEEDRVGASSCGVAEVDDIKSEECYEHDEESNERADELHDRKLFTQPDGSYLGECPLCFLPLPLDRSKSMFWSCCSEIICEGCVLANYKSNSCDVVLRGQGREMSILPRASKGRRNHEKENDEKNKGK